MLHKHHKTTPVIIIDEYDTPIQQAHLQDFYDRIILFMCNFFSMGVKDKSHLSFGFLTGILMELKVLRKIPSDSVVSDKLTALSQIVLEQINDKIAFRIIRFIKKCIDKKRNKIVIKN